MLFGCAEIDITPQAPITMGGYGARKGQSRGIKDPLFARTFVFQDGENQFSLITADLLMLNREQTSFIREEAERLTGIPKSSIIVSCSHTHSGPSTFSMGGFRADPDPHYVGWVLRALAGSVLMAVQDLEEVEIASGQRSITGVGSRRLEKEKSPLPLSLIAVKGTGKTTPQAILINYGCHPTVLGPENLFISPDFPGATIKSLRKLFPETVIGYINGAAGDISTRFERRGQNQSEVDRLGSILAGEVLALYNHLEFKEPVYGSLKVKSFSIEVPFRDLPPREERQKEIKKWEEKRKKLQEQGADPGEIRVAQTGLEGAKVQNYVADLQDQLEKTADITCGYLGDNCFVSIPGELFSSLARPLYELPFSATILCGYSNGHLGYIPSPEGFAAGGYEALSSPLAPTFGQEMVQTLEEILKEMI